MMILPSAAANVNVNQEIESYIQIGLETGQRSWEMDVRYPDPGLRRKTHYLFKGSLDQISAEVNMEIDAISRFGRHHGWTTKVVFEAGGFGQKLGRDTIRAGAQPIQLVARNIEYVRYGRQKDIPKTDRIDAKRQSHIPLDHPDLPYANVQHRTEEDLRSLFHEKLRLKKRIHRLNSQICAELRKCHIDTSHQSISGWLEFLPKVADKLTFSQLRILENRVTELNTTVEHYRTIDKDLEQQVKDADADWQPPVPEAIPAELGRHPLKALGENSPLRDKSICQALLEIKGIGITTTTAILALVGDLRRFKNKKAFRAFMGLAPTPYRSCSIRKSLGMKRGNPVLRKIMIQLAWRWCSLHPDTHLAKKYLPKLTGSRRSRKIAVCALAGELSEMLYSYLVNGKQIDGLSVKER